MVISARDRHQFQDKRAYLRSHEISLLISRVKGDPSRTREVFSFYLRDDSSQIQGASCDKKHGRLLSAVTCWDEACSFADVVDIGNTVIVEGTIRTLPHNDREYCIHVDSKVCHNDRCRVRSDHELSQEGKIVPYLGASLVFDPRHVSDCNVVALKDTILYPEQIGTTLAPQGSLISNLFSGHSWHGRAHLSG